MKKIIRIFILFGFAITTNAIAQRPTDFAYGVMVKTEGPDALTQIDIPQVIYEGVSRFDLGDIRVFNGKNEIVPHAIRSVEGATTTEKSESVPMPYFPLIGESRRPIDKIDVSIYNDEIGTILGVRSNQIPEKKYELRGYLVDLSSLKIPLSNLTQPVSALKIDWVTINEGLAGKLNIEAGDDLNKWTTIASQAPIVQLEHKGEKIIENKIIFNPVRAKYLRLSWPENQKPIELKSLSITKVEKIIMEVERTWKTVEGAPLANLPGQYYFNMGGRMPIDRIQVELPEPNTVVIAQIFSRIKPDGAWRSVNTSTLFRINRGNEEFRSPIIRTPTINDSEWLIRIDQRGGGLGQGLPKLKLGWLPQQLLFIKRGPSPFTIAYGNKQVQPSNYPIEMITAGQTSATIAKIEGPITTNKGQLGTPHVLGGESQLKDPLPIKKIILWGVLVLGVIIMAWMVLRLAWQITKNSEDSN